MGRLGFGSPNKAQRFFGWLPFFNWFPFQTTDKRGSRAPNKDGAKGNPRRIQPGSPIVPRESHRRWPSCRTGWLPNAYRKPIPLQIDMEPTGVTKKELWFSFSSGGPFDYFPSGSNPENSNSQLFGFQVNLQGSNQNLHLRLSELLICLRIF